MDRVKNIKRSSYLTSEFRSILIDKYAPQLSGIKNIYENSIKEDWDIYLFGGIPRSLWMEQKSFVFRDFDLVVSDESFEHFCSVYSSSIVRKNRFGGVKLNINNVDYDLWALSSTWAFRQGLVEDVSFETLPDTVFLNADSIVFELSPSQGNRRKVYEGGFYRAMKEKKISIKLSENPFPELCVLRALNFAVKYNFSFSPDLAHYICEKLSSISINKFVETQISHYGRLLFSEEDLVSYRSIMESCLEKGLLNVDLFEKEEQSKFLYYSDLEISNSNDNISYVRL